MKKTKVVEIVEAALGGIRQHVCDIVKNLNRQQYDVYLIYSENRADPAFLRELEELRTNTILIVCNAMHDGLGLKDIGAYRCLKKQLQEIQPDIVHCHSSKAGIAGRIAAKVCHVEKIIYTPNAYAFQSPELTLLKKPLYIWAERFLTRYFTTKTINVSKGERELAIRYKLDSEDKLVLIYNGIKDIPLSQKEDLKEIFGFCKSDFIVGVTARCADQKDPFTWLQIAEMVVGQNKTIKFVYIGDGSLFTSMKKWVENRNLTHSVFLLGFREEASEIVRMFDVYLSTALYEGLPYSMIEAMRAGVPIIATDVIGNNELVFDHINGRLFQIKDVKMGARLIMEQFSSRAITYSQVRETYMECFSLDVMIGKLTAIYNGSDKADDIASRIVLSGNRMGGGVIFLPDKSEVAYYSGRSHRKLVAA